MKANESQLKEAIAAVVVRATSDPAFRARAISEPVAALNEAGSLDLPLNSPIRFVEKQDEIIVPLPPFGSDPDEILDDEMLASVSGGTSPACAIGAYVIATAILGLIVNEFTGPKK